MHAVDELHIFLQDVRVMWLKRRMHQERAEGINLVERAYELDLRIIHAALVVELVALEVEHTKPDCLVRREL